jgi:glycosyltransferase involved in cell wall biosynthesis
MTLAALAESSSVQPPAARHRRLAIVASHPVQYQIPWYQALTRLIDVHVLYAHRVSAAEHARAGFDVEFEWDVPMFEGYSFEWLTNRASRPGVDHFWGCNTPDVGAAIERGRFDAVLVNGWNLWSYWQAIRAARLAGIPVLVRGDSQLPGSRGTLSRLLKRIGYPRMLASFDACLAVGERNAQYYRHYGVPERRIHRSPHCVDNTFFARAAAEARCRRGDIRRELGLPQDAVVFMFAGKLIDKKRPLDFLEAIGRVSAEGALRDRRISESAPHCRDLRGGRRARPAVIRRGDVGARGERGHGCGSARRRERSGRMRP